MSLASSAALLAELNEAQRAAVQHREGPAMIIAGAGSGKTRVLTYRLAYLIREGVCDSFDLLALTFTNKAAREMRERIEALVGTEARNITMGTFHSVFSRILRRDADKIGYTSSFTIYDEEDAVSLIRSIVKEMGKDDKKYKPKNLKHTISNCKNFLVSPKEYAAQHGHDEFGQIAARVYATYEQRMIRANAMDFDDLLVNMVKLFDAAPEVLYRYQHRYRFIMVDEYQDTNYAQYVITKRLARVHENLCVVGDDAQSIYSFRGANIENILSFSKDFPDVKVYKLEQNYRSTNTIVEAANEIIRHNQNQIPKRVFTENGEGDRIQLHRSSGEVEEAEKCVDTLRELKATQSLLNKDFAFLYRTNAQSRVLEDALRRAGVAYKVFGGMSFYRRKEIKDVVGYLRLAINPNDEEALKRVINYPTRGIGATTLDRVLEISREQNLPLWDVVSQADRLGVGRSAGAVLQFAQLIERLCEVARSENAYEAVNLTAKASGILTDLHKENSVEGRSRWENVQELINASREFVDDPATEDPSLETFLAQISLYSDQDEKIENDDYVTLMTIHAAKGLEFPAVFVTGLEEGLFPSSMSMYDRQDLEEERRLFYVAVTRARRFLTLSYARTRLRFGTPTTAEPSRFVEEIDPRFFQTPTGRHAEQAPRFQPTRRIDANRLSPVQQSLTPDAGPAEPFEGDDPDSFAVGMRVEHNKFGIGLIVEMEGKGAGSRAVIDFKDKGRKTLILKYARLRVVR